MTQETEQFDIIVVGAGPAGLSVGVAARQAGLNCAIFDKGCVTQSIALYPTYGHFFSTPDRLELGNVPFLTQTDKPTRREALKYYRRIVQHFDLDVRQYHEVTSVCREDHTFTVHSRAVHGATEARHQAHDIVIASGYAGSPNLLGIPGEELSKVSHYYHEAHPYFDQDVVVVGAGNSAVEAALDLYRAGARVSLVHFLDHLDAGVKPWVLPDITNRLKNGEIHARWHTRLAEVRPGSVLLRNESSGETEEIHNDFVLAMTGYRANRSTLQALGVSIEPRTGIPGHDPDTMETDVPGVFIAGVMAAGDRPDKIFIETGRLHGPWIVDAILRRDGKR
ncbi:MAG TPA: YpdA family putative bacillithiol disulfide reductase [Longimicrobiales bacterium]|nr:YpdA family putative bacillithiol disulfide reductase [Longimicrobiales bacterium]